MTGHPRPGLATRLAAAFHGEVGAATVEAYRRAGAAAYSDQADAERVRSELVEADYRADPRTVGYLPKVTAEQAAAFLGEVEHWAARARRTGCSEWPPRRTTRSTSPSRCGARKPVLSCAGREYCAGREWGAGAARAAYFVYRPVVIAGQSLTPIKQFAFDVSAEPMLEGGGEFVRHLVLGPFHASSQVDYGNHGSGE